MRILVIHFSDDNFGDMLIEHCFSQLLNVVSDNLKQPFEIHSMGLKNFNQWQIENSDLICFAGGGVFGLSYLNLFEHINAILSVAEEKQIPVIFSSIGVNNMDANDKNQQPLSDLLRLSCIKAISVRENPQLFKNFAGDVPYTISQVCDPAVWTKYVYNHTVQYILDQKSTREKKIVGINVVRGGLFADNGKDWTLGQEAEFFHTIKHRIEQAGYACKFYTNGSTLDNNTLLFFKKKYDISEDDLIFVDSTKELVETIALFDAVIAIRLHSAIICYSLDVPVVNLVWNDKIQLFYDAIRRPSCTFDLANCNEEEIVSFITNAEKNGDTCADADYLMSLYKFLYETLFEITNASNALPVYSFGEVAAKLSALRVSDEKMIADMKIKLYKGQKRYYGQFMSVRKKDAELKKAKEELTDIKNTVKKQTATISQQAKQLETLTLSLKKKETLLEKSNQSLEKTKQKAQKLQNKIDRIESMLIVRLYRKIQKFLRLFCK